MDFRFLFGDVCFEVQRPVSSQICNNSEEVKFISSVYGIHGIHLKVPTCYSCTLFFLQEIPAAQSRTSVFLVGFRLHKIRGQIEDIFKESILDRPEIFELRKSLFFEHRELRSVSSQLVQNE